ncbi:plant-specific TFIIB-related protein PTF2-like [Vicia villosa]|uniref:plant-specific TFIIB-related protein PTF2-like n=1 Tax=Vicia villosa TaxID=3911 RepID=UPI00273BA8D7|nr:plant-specific TFIIB-related protein PTF2-like [Vicia villosa]
MSTCTNCTGTSLFRDDETGDLFCSSCGAVQPFDQYESFFGGINGPQGTFVRIGTSGSGSNYSYKERKLFAARNSIEEFTNRLGLCSKTIEIKSMISDITEGEFGQGNWFQVLIGACCYVVMRKGDRPLPMGEIASALDCDVYELGKMIVRVIDFLDLRGNEFPEFDIVYSLERTINSSYCFADVDRSLVDKMKKQGVFLLQCAVKLFLSTGRRPLPLVVAILVLVAEINQVEIRMEDLAKEVHVAVSTCRTRYKELLETLVNVAQVLPWGKDITKKNIVKNAPFVIQYMEKRSMSKPVEKKKNVDQTRFDLEDVVAECLAQENGYEYGVDGLVSRKDSQYLSLKSNADREGIRDVDTLQISPECLSLMYEKFLNENRGAMLSRSVNVQKRKRVEFDFHECREWWDGESELSRKVILRKLLEKDIGAETMPPSFVNGQLKCKIRRERINAARKRIKRITHPFHVDCDDTVPSGILDSTCTKKRKKRRGVVVDDIDWEDLIIETLILHQVKEEEIEKGHYNTLLGLHVFNSGVV